MKGYGIKITYCLGNNRMTREEISKILYKRDFIDLARMEAPEDEYDFEANMLMDKLKECESAEDVGDHLHKIFNWSFAGLCSLDRSCFDETAYKIWKKHKKE